MAIKTVRTVMMKLIANQIIVHLRNINVQKVNVFRECGFAMEISIARTGAMKTAVLSGTAQEMISGEHVIICETFTFVHI